MHFYTDFLKLLEKIGCGFEKFVYIQARCLLTTKNE